MLKLSVQPLWIAHRVRLTLALLLAAVTASSPAQTVKTQEHAIRGVKIVEGLEDP